MAYLVLCPHAEEPWGADMEQPKVVCRSSSPGLRCNPLAGMTRSSQAVRHERAAHWSVCMLKPMMLGRR